MRTAALLSTRTLTLTLTLTFVVVLLAAVGRAGTISGLVRARGNEGAEPASGGGKYDSRKYKFVERVDYAELHEFVVYVVGPAGTNAARSAKPVQVVTTRRITQQGAVFSPHLLPILVGTTVEWPNSDDIFHNVFSISEPKEFDLGLYKHPEIKRVTFDKLGRVDVFCSIHKAMNCIILVLENPFFAATDARGQYSIPQVPAGTYTLKAWHERLPGQSLEVTVPADGEVRIDFTLAVANLPKY